jgi:hypothetical protein
MSPLGPRVKFGRSLGIVAPRYSASSGTSKRMSTWRDQFRRFQRDSISLRPLSPGQPIARAVTALCTAVKKLRGAAIVTGPPENTT